MWSSTCFAVMSSATLAKKRFVPMPAVAQIPHSRSTSAMSWRASVRASVW